ncbi:MAG TPA: type II secretion system F family protein, partial [Verrucomicrobiae bacterium]|nr:type II secretion system F family protein [Verrucomicrobiae bacterium]
ALKARQLPELYRRLVLVGIKSSDLPGALNMLADYYQRRHVVWTRLKGLMVYPLIVLSAAFLLSCFLSFILGAFIWNNLLSLVGKSTIPAVSAGLWMSPVFLGLAVAVGSFVVMVSPVRRKFSWRLPAFKEANLARVASVMWLLLKNGVPLNDALALVAQLEAGTAAGDEIAQWRQRLASGRGKFSEMAVANKIFPPLFIWMVANAGENLEAGFRRAAEIYQGRALYRADVLLYSALPCSILALAVMIMAQIQPVFASLIAFMNSIGGQ